MKTMKINSKVKVMQTKYDTDIELLKNAISDMQQLLKNPAKLAEICKIHALETPFKDS